MKYAYYINKKSGQIKSYHALIESWTADEINEKINEYNEQDYDNKVVVIDVEEHSFYDQGTIREALDALDQAKDAIENIKELPMGE